MPGTTHTAPVTGFITAVRRIKLPTAFYASSVLVLSLFLGVLLGNHLPHGREFHNGELFRRLISWDGNWYLDIGQRGYSWNPTAGPRVQQNIAFFPVQGLIDKLAIAIFGGNALAAIIAISLAFGIAAIFSFEAFVRSVDADRAVAATWLFALWPAAIFIIMGYPTGLISLCVIEALHATWRGQKWRAAVYLGIGTATAPTVVFVAAGMAIAQGLRAVRRGSASGFLVWGLWCGVAFSGLFLFMAYQAIALHDTMAFIESQDAWEKAAPTVVKLVRLLSPLRYVEGVFKGVIKVETGAALMRDGARAPGLYLLQGGLQFLLSYLWFALALIGLVKFTAAAWRRCLDIVFAGWSVYLGYLWFIVASDQLVTESARLLFPMMAAFLGLSPTGAMRGSFRRLLAYLATFAALEAAFVVAGYWIL